jgi:subtilisin family serine protease
MMKNTSKFVAKSVSVLIGLSLVIGSTPSYAGPLSANGSPSGSPAKSAARAVVDGTISPEKTEDFIIVYKSGTNLDLEASNLAKIKAPQGRRFSALIPAFATKLNAKQISQLQVNPNVAYIEKDSKITLIEPSSDFVVVNQASAPWGLDRIDSPNLPRDNFYTYSSSGSGVTAYVVDTGIISNHVDFTSRVTTGFSAISDANGTSDCNGHGTHVAGTIGGSTYGVAKNVRLVPVRVLDCAGSGSNSGVIAGLEWIGRNYVAGTPAVVNMSLGGGISSALDSAVNALISKGIVVVVAAGNSTVDACTSSPARVPAAITVAASTSTDAFASYSNFGSCVDVVAPGSSIVSAWITSDTSAATASGTSMASPHVAGTIALYLSGGYKDPGALQATLLQKATKGKVTSIRTGTPNLMVHTDPLNSIPVLNATAPEAPTNVRATAAPKRIASASWVLPTAVAGSPLVAVTSRLFESTGRLVSSTRLSGSATSISYTNLKIGTKYFVEVSVANAVGSSASVRSNTITGLR